MEPDPALLRLSLGGGAGVDETRRAGSWGFEILTGLAMELLISATKALGENSAFSVWLAASLLGLLG